MSKEAALAILNDGSTDRQPQLPLLKLGLLVAMFAGLPWICLHCLPRGITVFIACHCWGVCAACSSQLS